MFRDYWKSVNAFMRRVWLLPVKVYRVLISPMIRPRCKYIPTCSDYFEQAVGKYGILRGSAKGIYRVLRCNPFSKGGYDPLT